MLNRRTSSNVVDLLSRLAERINGPGTFGCVVKGERTVDTEPIEKATMRIDVIVLPDSDLIRFIG